MPVTKSGIGLRNGGRRPHRLHVPQLWQMYWILLERHVSTKYAEVLQPVLQSVWTYRTQLW